MFYEGFWLVALLLKPLFPKTLRSGIGKAGLKRNQVMVLNSKSLSSYRKQGNLKALDERLLKILEFEFIEEGKIGIPHPAYTEELFKKGVKT